MTERPHDRSPCERTKTASRKSESFVTIGLSECAKRSSAWTKGCLADLKLTKWERHWSCQIPPPSEQGHGVHPKRRRNLFGILRVQDKLINVKLTHQFDENIRAIHQTVKITRFEFSGFEAREFREPVWNREGYCETNGRRFEATDTRTTYMSSPSVQERCEDDSNITG
jgi:hypothetical protein